MHILSLINWICYLPKTAKLIIYSGLINNFSGRFVYTSRHVVELALPFHKSFVKNNAFTRKRTTVESANEAVNKNIQVSGRVYDTAA